MSSKRKHEQGEGCEGCREFGHFDSSFLAENTTLAQKPLQQQRSGQPLPPISASPLQSLPSLTTFLPPSNTTLISPATWTRTGKKYYNITVFTKEAQSNYTQAAQSESHAVEVKRISHHLELVYQIFRTIKLFLTYSALTTDTLLRWDIIPEGSELHTEENLCQLLDWFNIRKNTLCKNLNMFSRWFNY